MTDVGGRGKVTRVRHRSGVRGDFVVSDLSFTGFKNRAETLDEFGTGRTRTGTFQHYS